MGPFLFIPFKHGLEIWCGGEYVHVESKMHSLLAYFMKIPYNPIKHHQGKKIKKKKKKVTFILLDMELGSKVSSQNRHC